MPRRGEGTAWGGEKGNHPWWIREVGNGGSVRVVTRRNVSSGSPFEPKYGFSRAVRVGDRVLVAGTAPIWPDDFVDPDPAEQAKRCIEIMLDALAEAGGGPEDVVRTRMFITDAAHADRIGEAHGEFFSEIRPASTMVVVGGLLDPRWHVEMELEALLTG
jgi:enamine deaminase RidA (YjgF/YER057c/UK114 family)